LAGVRTGARHQQMRRGEKLFVGFLCAPRRQIARCRGGGVALCRGRALSREFTSVPWRCAVRPPRALSSTFGAFVVARPSIPACIAGV
jgi:hypothetical protein